MWALHGKTVKKVMLMRCAIWMEQAGRIILMILMIISIIYDAQIPWEYVQMRRGIFWYCMGAPLGREKQN